MDIIKKADGRYYKPCPTCGEEQSYLRRNYAVLSMKEGKECKKCNNRNPEHNAHKGWVKGVLRHSFARKYVINAEVRGIEWDVTFEELADILIQQDFKCALTGWPISAMEVNSNPASLDRIDSSEGYTPENVHWVHSMVNMSKQAYSLEEFIEMCRSVAVWNEEE